MGLVRLCFHLMQLEAPLDEARCPRKLPWLFEKASSLGLIEYVRFPMGGTVVYKKGILRGGASKKRDLQEEAAPAAASANKKRKHGAAKTADNAPEILSGKTQLAGYKA